MMKMTTLNKMINQLFLNQNQFKMITPPQKELCSLLQVKLVIAAIYCIKIRIRWIMTNWRLLRIWIAKKRSVHGAL